MPVCNSVRPLTFAPATRIGQAGRSALFITVALLAATGCNKPAAAPAVNPKACDEYNTKICEATGDKSSTCKEVKGLTALMGSAACSAALTEFPKAKTALEERRKACDQLATKLCNDIGTATQTCEMAKTQLKNVEPEQCTKMMEQYAPLLADLKQREARNQPLTAEKAAELAKTAGPAFGPETAAVTIVEFSDFQCPYCSRAAETTKRIKEKYGNQVRFVFRQFPLSFHKQAHLAAEASLAAHAQGKFWEFHDKLFSDQKALERPGLEASAKAVGLNLATFKKALDSNEYGKAVEEDMKLGEAVNVNGTPTLFLNGKRIDDPSNFDFLSKAIDEALGKKPEAPSQAG